MRTQVFVANLTKRSVRLDVLATDIEGRVYNIEIQRDDRGAGRKRARFNSSMMDANLLSKGEKFNKLPDTYVIFITEHDVIGKGWPLYHFERCLVGTDELFGDGSHIVYVNGANQDDSPIGRLMHDFACKDPSDMHYDVLADRVRFFKESKEGVAIMCKAIEDMRKSSFKEGVKKGKKKGLKKGMAKGLRSVAIRMLNTGKYTIDEIVSISGLSIREVEKLQSE